MKISTRYRCNNCDYRFEGTLIIQEIPNKNMIKFIHDSCPSCKKSENTPYIPPGEAMRNAELPFEYYAEVTESALGSRHTLSLRMQRLRGLASLPTPVSRSTQQKSIFTFKESVL